MSFNINNWGRWSVSYNSFPPNQWAYTGIKNGESDSLDVMKAPEFFEQAFNFLKVGHLIYLEGAPTAPIFPSREFVVVTSLNPVTVESLNGVTPLLAVVNTMSFEANAVGFTQIINLSGVLATDLIMVNITINPSNVVIHSAVTGSDIFTLVFSANPGGGVFIDALIFRASFL